MEQTPTKDELGAPLPPKTDQEICEGINKMLENVPLNLMLASICPIMLKGMKKTSPELFYITKGRFKNILSVLDKTKKDLETSLSDLDGEE